MSEAKEYLMQIEKLDKLIDRKIAKRDLLRSKQMRITPTLKEDVISGGGVQDKLAEASAQIIDLEKELDRDIDRYVDLQRQAERLLEKVAEKNAKHYEILHRRYIEHETFVRIACEMGYADERGATKLHGRALQTFGKVLQEHVPCFTSSDGDIIKM
jgi:hypothetical protein